MRAKTIQRPVYRVPPSKYWAQYWYPRSVGIIATFQLIMTFSVVSMEIGNTVVDIFRSNVFSGYWSFPFMLAATIASYACVCAKPTQSKAIIALILQCISIVIMIIVIGFLMAFIATNYTLCFVLQCSQNSSTSFSSSTYLALKQGFIGAEFVCSTIYITLAIIYIVLFIKCYKKLPQIHPLIRPQSRSSLLSKQQASTVFGTSQPMSSTVVSSNRTDTTVAAAAAAYSGAQKICPNCQHASPYIPEGNRIECPNCKYQSPLVEHAQQWSSRTKP